MARRGRRAARRSTPRPAARCSSSCTTACARSSGVPATPRSRSSSPSADVVDRELPAVRVRRAAVARRASRASIVCSITPVRPHRAVRRAPDHRVHRAGGVGRTRRAGFGAQRAVPGRRAHQRVVGGHVLGDGGRGRGAARAARPGHGDHIDFSIAEVMTIAASSYAEYIRALLGNPPIIGATAHDRDAVGRADPRRLRRLLHQQPPAVPQLPAAHRPPRSHRRRPVEQPRRPPEAAGTSGTTSSTRGRRSTRPPRSCAWPASCASRWRRCTAATNILECDHFVARNVFVDDAIEARSRCRAVRGAWTTRTRRRRARRRASVSTPARSSRTRRAPPPASIGPDELPLAGVRVLDLTAWWAGPIAAGALAALGADVIHVESVSRIDGMRATGAGTGMDGPWWERSAHYLCSNTNKRDLTLDLGTDDGLGDAAAPDRRERRGARELLAAGARQLRARLGADPGAQPALPPRAHARVRPVGTVARQRRASRRRWSRSPAWRGSPATVDDQPRIQQGPSDPNAGMHAAFALIVGLAEREATGRGSLLEVTMVEGALNAAAELVLEATAYGNLLERDGNRSPNVAPQGLYRGRERRDVARGLGRDRRRSGEALVDALGRRRGRPTPTSPTYAGRRARHDELDAQLGEWAATHDVGEAAELLSAHGVPAAVGRDPRSMIEHPQLQARGLLRGHRPPGRRPLSRRRRCRSASRRSTAGCARPRRRSASTTTRSWSTTSASTRRRTRR